MAHGTKINGTAYEIKGGRTKIGGTGYSISKGRTKVGGTGYDISFGPPTFTVSFPSSTGAPTLTFSFEEGMTWQQFILSDYNLEHSVASAACEWISAFLIGPDDLCCWLFYDAPPYGPGITVGPNGDTASMDLGAGQNQYFNPFYTIKTRNGTPVSMSNKITTGEAYQCS